jgi:broad specificity phosphatase PhoE
MYRKGRLSSAHYFIASDGAVPVSVCCPYAKLQQTPIPGAALPPRPERPGLRAEELMRRDHVSFQRRPFLTPIWLTALAVVVALSFAVFAAWVWGTAGSTTVIVIRHAERDLSVSLTDPPLSPAGEARAALLARMFGDAKVVGHLDAIYVSPALRNRLTVAPLAARLGINATVAPVDDPRALAHRALREHAGGRVLIVGHSDTVPKIAAVLSGNPKIPEIGDQEYGTMYIVTVPRIGHANLLRLNY